VKDRIFEIIILLAMLLLVMLVTGCAVTYQTQIEAEQQEFQKSQLFSIGCTDAGTHSAVVLTPQILNFHGYDSHFKFDNMIALLQSKPENQWWPYWGAK